MKSNVCKIKKGTFDLTAILAETERVALYRGLSGKDALGLRLLAEELVSMLPSIVRNFDGDFWVEANGADYELHVKMRVEGMDLATRDELIKVSSTRQNASAAGITGKICAIFDYMALGGNEAEMLMPPGQYGLASTIDYSQMWSLRAYRDTLSGEETERWDELEKSIIAKLSDDVVVGVRGRKVNIIIKKNMR